MKRKPHAGHQKLRGKRIEHGRLIVFVDDWGALTPYEQTEQQGQILVWFYATAAQV